MQHQFFLFQQRMLIMRALWFDFSDQSCRCELWGNTQHAPVCQPRQENHQQTDSQRGSEREANTGITCGDIETTGNAGGKHGKLYRRFLFLRCYVDKKNVLIYPSYHYIEYKFGLLCKMTDENSEMVDHSIYI